MPQPGTIAYTPGLGWSDPMRLDGIPVADVLAAYRAGPSGDGKNAA
jgi:hypothetical protein